MLKNKWDDWWESWFYIAMEPHDRLTLPTGPAEADAKWWEHLSTEEDALTLVLVRISELWESGLTAPMVVADFVARRLALLRVCGRPAWMYTGDHDYGRMQVSTDSYLSPNMLKKLLVIMLGKSHGDHHLPRSIFPLCEEGRHWEILEKLLEFEAWGVKVSMSGEPVGGPKVGKDTRVKSSGAYAMFDDRVEGKKMACSPSPPITMSSSESSLSPPQPAKKTGDLGKGAPGARWPCWK